MQKKDKKIIFYLHICKNYCTFAAGNNCKLHSYMKRIYLFAALFAAMTVGLMSCDKDKNNTAEEESGATVYDPGNKVEDHLLTAEQSKNKLMGIAQMMAAKFNPSDQKAALDLADQMADKYERYSWNDMENYFEDTYAPIYQMPRYVARVAKGTESVSGFMAYDYVFSFSKDKAIFEADDRNATWKYVGKPTENCVILRCSDNNGNLIEAKCWPEGATKTVSYDYEVVDNATDRKIQKHVQGELPEKICFSLKQGSTEHIHMEITQNIDFDVCNKIYFDLNARISNLRWTTTVNINPTSGSMAQAFYYGDEKLLSAAVNLPSYQLIAKTDRQSYEDWIKQYDDQYDDLIGKIGSADAVVDIMGWVQVKANVSDWGYLYSQGKKYHYASSYREDAQNLCNLINNNFSNGIYYGSDIKQAEVRAQVARRTESEYDYYSGTTREYTEFYPEGVLYFPQDQTTYAFEEYFVRKPFTDILETAENIANKYIRVSQLLNENVGEVHFHEEEY